MEVTQFSYMTISKKCSLPVCGQKKLDLLCFCHSDLTRTD